VLQGSTTTGFGQSQSQKVEHVRLNELDLGSRLTPTRSHPHSELKRPNDQFHFFADKGVWVKEPLQKMAQNRIDQDSKMMLASKQDFVGKKKLENYLIGADEYRAARFFLAQCTKVGEKVPNYRKIYQLAIALP
jgi:hypothetical protein